MEEGMAHVNLPFINIAKIGYRNDSARAKSFLYPIVAMWYSFYMKCLMYCADAVAALIYPLMLLSAYFLYEERIAKLSYTSIISDLYTELRITHRDVPGLVTGTPCGV